MNGRELAADSVVRAVTISTIRAAVGISRAVTIGILRAITADTIRAVTISTIRSFAIVVGGLVAMASAAGSAHAHHSFNVFDMETEKTLSGEVVEFRWTNPHTWTWINVTNEDGTVTKWGLEGMSPNFLGRRGWSRHTLTPGDRIEVVIAPLKSGEPGGTFLRATLPDGTVKVMFGGR